jgi:hypothetical protein
MLAPGHGCLRTLLASVAVFVGTTARLYVLGRSRLARFLVPLLPCPRSDGRLRDRRGSRRCPAACRTMARHQSTLAAIGMDGRGWCSSARLGGTHPRNDPGWFAAGAGELPRSRTRTGRRTFGVCRVGDRASGARSRPSRRGGSRQRVDPVGIAAPCSFEARSSPRAPTRLCALRPRGGVQPTSCGGSTVAVQGADYETLSRTTPKRLAALTTLTTRADGPPNGDARVGSHSLPASACDAVVWFDRPAPKRRDCRRRFAAHSVWTTRRRAAAGTVPFNSRGGAPTRGRSRTRASRRTSRASTSCRAGWCLRTARTAPGPHARTHPRRAGAFVGYTDEHAY